MTLKDKSPIQTDLIPGENQHSLGNLNQNLKNRPHQDPQGILNQKAKNQDSPGILKNQTPFITTRETFESLSVNEINLYTDIPYYMEQTTSIYPTIVKTPLQNHCIDGDNLIKEAIKGKLESIMCHIFHIAEESEIELAIRKTAIRMTPEKGKPYYAEFVRNCKKLENFLIETTENPVMHSHGGKRKGVDYTLDNRENNIRSLMVERLGKSVSTTNKYINYGGSLNDDILDTLVQSKEGKKFFEAAASNKRRLIKNLKCDNKDEVVITEKVSIMMALWLEEFHETGKIKPLPLENNNEPVKNKCPIDLPKSFEHHNEYEKNQEVETQEFLHQEIQTILEGLCNFVKEDVGNNEEFTTIIKGEIGKIAIRLSKYDVLTEQIPSVQNKEVC